VIDVKIRREIQFIITCPKVNRRRKYNVWYNETHVKPVLIGAGIIRRKRR